MRVPGLEVDFDVLPAPLPAWRASVDAADWSATARFIAEHGGRLLSLWGTDRSGEQGGGLAVAAAYAIQQGLLWVDLPVADAAVGYPDISALFPCAARMQRAAYDLVGIAPTLTPTLTPAADRRPWLNHGAWPQDFFPLRWDSAEKACSIGALGAVTDYAFVRVEGDGVHEIPVGPVHAGIIEPGHFRFSVVGEKVLRLEQRLGYTHKGVERRFTQLPPLEAHRLAGRISGDSTLAYAWAYCMALESAVGCAVPERALWLRALMLERERVANHLGDLGALGNDAALAFGLAQFSRLKEDWLRLSKEAFGHRLTMDCVVPGGVRADVTAAFSDRLRRQCDAIEREVLALRTVYEEHSGLQDRFLTTGRIKPALATRLGLTGLAGRSSGLAVDLRCDRHWFPYSELDVEMAAHLNGDVAARVAVRFDETIESLRLIRAILDRLPGGATQIAPSLPPNAATGGGCAGAGYAGMGWVEGWRGEIFVALELGGADEQHAIRRCHCHDPSWQNWPVLEHAVIGNIVPDFPLINKSFNLSYSGHDL